MRVRNIRTGVESEYPERQAQWLISTGRCEAVRPKREKPVQKPIEPQAAKPKATEETTPKTAKQTYQTKDLKAANVAVSETTEKPE